MGCARRRFRARSKTRVRMVMALPRSLPARGGRGGAPEDVAAASDGGSSTGSDDDALEAPVVASPRGLAASEAVPTESADGDAREADEADETDEEDAPLEPFDLYAALGVRAAAKGGVSGGRSRCFAAFRAQCARRDPEWFRGSSGDVDGWLAFRRVALAFAVLSDAGRRAVYENAGFDGLRRSEALSEIDAFDLDPIGIFDDFYEARGPCTGTEDADLKEFLLLEAGGQDDNDDDAVLDGEADDEIPVVVGRADGTPRPRDDAAGAAMPPPPPGLGVGLAGGPRPPTGAAYPGADAWAKLAALSP